VAGVNSKILVIEADLDVAEIISTHFREEGYQVISVNSGDKGLQTCQEENPDLVVIAARLPDKDGFEVARLLRIDRRTQDIPIIFLNEKGTAGERLQGLEIGADDYLTKPVDIYELRLRVRNALRRASQWTLTNPVSGLPEGALVDEKLKEILLSEGWTILLVSLVHLDAFRDTYGFVAADDVLRAVGMIVQNALREGREPGDFIGHLTTTDLIVMSPADEIAALGDLIQSRIEQSLENFYPIEDRDQLADLRERLSVRVVRLDSESGNYETIDALKERLLGL
jgi:PleD family two-component response regulator